MSGRLLGGEKSGHKKGSYLASAIIATYQTCDIGIPFTRAFQPQGCPASRYLKSETVIPKGFSKNGVHSGDNEPAIWRDSHSLDHCHEVRAIGQPDISSTLGP